MILGKTKIAIEVIKYALITHPSKVVLFVAPTNPLCQQQADAIREDLLVSARFSPPVTVYVSGSTSTVNWVTTPKLGRSVVVGTPQKLLNDLDNNLLPWDLCSLLVMDECHHTDKDHPCKFIMGNYEAAIKKCKVPRVLGLTASPAADVSEEKVIDRIINLCLLMRCRLAHITETDTELHQEIQRVVPIPKIQEIAINENNGYSYLRGALEKIHRQGPQSLQVSSTMSEDIDWTEMLEEADEAGELDDNTQSFFFKNIIIAICAIEVFQPEETTRILAKIQHLHSDIPKIVAALGKLKGVEPPKAVRLWDLLRNELEKNPKARGIIFVDVRSIADAMAKSITSHVDPAISSAVKPQIFLGRNNKSGPLRMSTSEQKDALEDFKKGNKNLLVATSVAEEGIDVQNCNFVVRVSARMTPLSMIQSRGRARYPDSSYYVLVAGSEDTRFLKNAVDGEKMMKKVLEAFNELDALLSKHTCETSWNDADLGTTSLGLKSQPTFEGTLTIYKNRLQE